MAGITLTLGAGQADRIIKNADELLIAYRKDIGYVYLNYPSTTPSDRVVPEDLAVTMLMNSQVGARAFQTLAELHTPLTLERLSNKKLEETTDSEREDLAKFIAKIAQLPGFAASVATKLLHKKRPELIPILDNQAIFDAYMNPAWPSKPAKGYSIKDCKKIRMALEWIFFDINRMENRDAWLALKGIEPKMTNIELFDCVWWMHFRNLQPVNRRKTED